MPPATIHCLVLACGNALRSDDGLGPWLARWIDDHYGQREGLRVLARPQWSVELAETVAAAQQVLFLDCALANESTSPGEILFSTVYPATQPPALLTHHLDAEDLLALAQALYGRHPARAQLLAVGAGSLALGEGFSPAVTHALPVLRHMLAQLLDEMLPAPQPIA